MAKVHFRDYNPKQIILFPQRLDKDIAKNDPVRIVDTIVDQLKLDFAFFAIAFNIKKMCSKS